MIVYGLLPEPLVSPPFQVVDSKQQVAASQPAQQPQQQGTRPVVVKRTWVLNSPLHDDFLNASLVRDFNSRFLETLPGFREGTNGFSIARRGQTTWESETIGTYESAETAKEAHQRALRYLRNEPGFENLLGIDLIANNIMALERVEIMPAPFSWPIM